MGILYDHLYHHANSCAAQHLKIHPHLEYAVAVTPINRELSTPSEYCDCVLAALRARYCDCCAMSLWHQVFLVLCIVYCVPGISSVVYCVLGTRY